MPIDMQPTPRQANTPVRLPTLSLPWAGGTAYFDENLNLLGWQADEPGDTPDVTPDVTPPQTCC